VKIKIDLIDDVELARDMHTLAFPYDDWVGDDHTFWVAHDGAKSRALRGIYGFASAILREEKGYVYLSRSAVIKAAHGLGIQRKLIAARVAWGKAQGAHTALTYTTLKNYESIVNLLKCGFRFDHPKIPYAGRSRRVHYFVKSL
jgi:GNAT superfamily N-acetyltransferase